jgi:protein O-GlcNAc transferase
VACHRKAIGINPNDADYHYNLGNALERLGRSEEAVACHRKAIAINPNNASYHCNLGLALDDLGRYEEAVACYHRAIQLDHNAQCAYENFEILLLYRCKTAAKLRESVQFL